MDWRRGNILVPELNKEVSYCSSYWFNLGKEGLGMKLGMGCKQQLSLTLCEWNTEITVREILAV